MLDDPDAKIEEWEDDIFADSLIEAQARCKQKAAYMTSCSGTLVRSLGAKLIKGKLYKCQFCSEVSNAND